VDRVSPGAYTSAAGAVLRRDLQLYLSYPARFPMRVLTAVFSLALFHYISQLVAVERFSDPEDYFAFVVVGLVILEVLQATLGVAGALRQELLTGNFERVVLSPFGPVPAIAAMALLPLLLAFVLALVMLGAGALFFDLPVRWSQAPLALPVALLGSAAFAALGLLFAAVVVVFKQATSAATFFVALVSLFSGVYFPVALLPGWAESVSGVEPFRPTVDLLRHLLLDTPMSGSMGAALARLGAFVVVLAPLSVLALRVAIRHTQRSGTIAEY
jgi:ABC-2 type transport system permease protein